MESLEWEIERAQNEMNEWVMYWNLSPLRDPVEEDLRQAACNEYMRCNLRWRDLKLRRAQILDAKFVAESRQILNDHPEDMRAIDAIQTLVDNTSDAGAVRERIAKFMFLRRFRDARETMAALRVFFARLP